MRHNGIDLSAIPFRERPDGYLAFLGRMSPEKAPAEGIARRARACCSDRGRVPRARRAGVPETSRRSSGAAVVWLGELDAAGKYALLAGARALLFPIAWPEPFGMVMIEAMACGTPVLATSQGSVAEVVGDGYTGFVRADPEELAAP